MELNLNLKRNDFSDHTTIGNLFVEKNPQCYVLEDKDRGLQQTMPLAEIEKTKVHGTTCIPYGKYEVLITLSNKFGIHYPLVNNVPGYAGIRMHCGTCEADTLGCLLMGMEKVKDGLHRSQEAFFLMFEKLLAFKTDAETAKTLIAIHKKFRDKPTPSNDKPELAKEFADMYNKFAKQDNKIYITIEK